MATASAAAGVRRPGPGSTHRRAAPTSSGRLASSSSAVGVFVFYQYIYPDLDRSAQTFFRDWLPLTAVNEALVFVIMALGLNIVVGYAGLLDLGYVAFWAIGGYTAGWLMSAFIHKVNIHLGGTAPRQPWASTSTSGSSCSSAGLFCALWASSSVRRRCGSRATTWPS